MGPKQSLLVCSLVLAGLTATAQMEQTESGDQQPQWLLENMQREASRLKPKKVRFGEMRSRLPGEISIGPVQKDKLWHVGTDIGGDYPVVCFIHEQEMNLANTVAAQADFDVASVAERIGIAVTARQATSIAAGEIDGSPYLGLQYQYRIGDGEDARTGLIKVWAAARMGTTLVCKHNEIGFRDSVFQLFENFVESFDRKNAPPKPYYGATLVASADGQPVGIAAVRFTRDDTGYTRVETSRSTLRTDATGMVTATDRYDLIWSEADGELINAYSSRVTDGTEDYSLSLSYAEDAWNLSGTLGGEDLQKAIETETRPLTPLGWYRLLRAASDSEGADPVAFTTWMPGAAPTALVEATFARQGSGAGLLTIGQVSSRMEFDEDGYIRTATTDGDSDSLVLTRVWRDGKFH